MADIVITLLTGSSPNADNFNIYGMPGNHLLLSGVTKADLAAGVTINGVDSDTYPQIKVSSNSSYCSTSVTHDIFPSPTPTPTVGATSPQYSFNIATGNEGDANTNGSACRNFNVDPNILIWSQTSEGFLVDGQTYYTEFGTLFNGRNFYYSDGMNYGRITSLGVYTRYGACGLYQP